MIGDANRPLTSRRTIPINNNGGEPFGRGGNGPPRGRPPRGGGSVHLRCWVLGDAPVIVAVVDPLK